MATNCQFLKANLLDFFGGMIGITEVRDHCVLTLPQKTIDDRLAAVFVEEKMPGHYLVHDGGKTSAELFAQGIHLTDFRVSGMEDLAERYGATFAQGTFRILCDAKDLSTAIMAISQCAILGTWYILAHKPSFKEEPILHRVEHALETWRAPYEQRIEKRVRVIGQKMEHTLDFVSFPRNGQLRNPIGLKVVRPSDNSLDQARGYGFMAYDLERTSFGQWPRVAIVTKADEWSDTALDLVRASGTATIPIDADNESSLEKLLHEELTEIAA